MQFGYTIIYVPSVSESLSFFEKAFGFARRFLHDSGDYGELNTGGTTLAFASHALGAMNFPSGYVAANASAQPIGMEVAFVTPNVAKDHAAAVAAGAIELKAPESKPWGQTVSYLRCPDGTVVELCTPVTP
jgi:lactoylglutathione lyase